MDTLYARNTEYRTSDCVETTAAAPTACDQIHKADGPGLTSKRCHRSNWYVASHHGWCAITAIDYDELALLVAAHGRPGRGEKTLAVARRLSDVAAGIDWAIVPTFRLGSSRWHLTGRGPWDVATELANGELALLVERLLPEQTRRETLDLAHRLAGSGSGLDWGIVL